MIGLSNFEANFIFLIFIFEKLHYFKNVIIRDV